MTLEASLVLPIFLFYMMTLLYSLEIVRFQNDAWEALHQESIRIGFAEYENYYGEQGAGDEDNSEQNIKKYLNRQILPYLCVKDGRQGIHITEEKDCLGKGNVQISANYEIKPFIGWLPIGEILIEDSCFVHGFIGYQKDALWEQEQETERYVYITSTGSKYHLLENCTYLKVQIQAASSTDIKDLRNASGEIYYPCDTCDNKGGGLVYYTKWGNRYHGMSDCAALKRTVYMIPLSKVGPRTACSKCA